MTEAVGLATLSWRAGDRSALLIHGITSSAAGWWRVARSLCEIGYTVTAPDLRGHGASPAGSDQRLASMAADVLALGTRWDLVLGHSMGGSVAIAAATARPEW